MPKNATILMIRHAEKPEGDDTGLAVAGQQRAQAYVVYFQNYVLDGGAIKLDYLFATADSQHSHRPKLTLKPLSKALDLPINDDYKNSDKDQAALVKLLNEDTTYDGNNILICWHHGEILDLAAELGVNPSQLPPSSNWPPKPWPDAVFGWVLQIRYDGDGNVIPVQTECFNQKLMYDDHGLNPPAVMVKLKSDHSDEKGEQS